MAALALSLAALVLMIGPALSPRTDATALDQFLEGCAVRSVVPPEALIRGERGDHGERATTTATRPEDLRFLVAGHLYGRPGLIGGGWIAGNFRRAVGDLRRRRPAFLVSLGDLVRSSNQLSFDVAVGRLSKLGVPVFNTPGNHDVDQNRAGYERRFGRTFGALRRGHTLLVFLDTERSPWNLDRIQLEFLERLAALASPAAGAEIQNVFLFAHRVIFAAGELRYRPLLLHCNSRAGYAGTSNFATGVAPLLARFRRFAGVYWFAGDVGVPWSYGMFYDRHPESGVVYLATGIGDTEHDTLLSVRVSGAGAVEIERIALGGVPLPPLEECGPEFWRAHFQARKQLER